MTALSCDDVVGRLVNAGVPVLFLDTCLILDIVRAPIREPISVPDIQAVHTLLSRVAQTPPTVSVVIADQVEHEFQEHIEKVERETLTELKRTRERFAGILERMAALAPSHDIPDSVDLVSLGFPAKGRQLAEQIVQKSIVMEKHQDEVVKAFGRVNIAKPPATQAKQSVKDCVITESYLRLASALRVAGFSRNTVFATSNTKDYQQGHRTLHPALRTEFSAICLEYSPCWSAARNELDRVSEPVSGALAQ